MVGLAAPPVRCLVRDGELPSVNGAAGAPVQHDDGHHSEQLTAAAAVLGQLLAGRTALTPVAVALREALGCVLGEPLVAPGDLPPFACSAMDGFAVRSADVVTAPVELRVTAATMAGDAPGPELHEGEAARVMTGAPVPAGADAVVMIELTSPGAQADRVVVERAAAHGQYIRPAGDDVRAGDLVFGSGEVLGPAHLGIIAGLGRSRVVVHPRPRVGVLSTGDELADPSEALRAGRIRDSNGVTLSAALLEAGCSPVELGAVGDDAEKIAEAVEEATRRCDAVITTGGVSVGDRDVVALALASVDGAVVRTFRIAIKPGKPFAFAELPGGVPVFALPGNPVSSMVAFELLVRPVLRRMAGHSSLHRPSGRAVADEELRRQPDGRVHLFRARARLAEDGRLHVSSAGAQGSHQLSALAGANALAVLPDGGAIPAGGEVTVMLLDAGRLGSEPPPELAAVEERSGLEPAGRER